MHKSLKFLLCLVVCLIAWLTRSATLEVVTTNFTSAPLTGVVRLNNVLTPSTFTQTLATNNVAWFSNIVAATYNLTLQRPVGWLAYTFVCPDTNIVLDVHTLVTNTALVSLSTGLTTNFTLVFTGSNTNTLYYTNGLLKAITHP
jgi:hypothetical protein